MTNSDGIFDSDTRNPWENFGRDFAVDKYKNRHYKQPELNGSESFLPYKDVSWSHDSSNVSGKRERPASNRRVKIPCKRIRRNAQNSTRRLTALDAIIEADSPSSAPDDIFKSASNTGSEEEVERSREPVLLKLAKSDCHIDRIEEHKPVALRGEGLPKSSLMDRSVWSVVSQATSHLINTVKTPQTTKFMTDCANSVMSSVIPAVPSSNVKSDSHSRKQAIYNSTLPNNPQTVTACVPNNAISNTSAIAENVTTARANVHSMNLTRGSDSSAVTKCTQEEDSGRSVRGTRVTLPNRGKTRSTTQSQNAVNEVIELPGGEPSPNNDDRDVEIDPYFGTFGSLASGSSEKHMKVDGESSHLRNGFYKWHDNTSGNNIYAGNKTPDLRFCTEQNKFRKNIPSWECQVPVPRSVDESMVPSELPANEATWNTMSGREGSSFPSSLCRVPNNLRTIDTLQGGRRNVVDSLHSKRVVQRTSAAVIRSYQTQFIDVPGTMMGEQSTSCFTGGTSRVNKQRLNNPDLRDWMREARRRHQALRQERVSGNHSPSAFSNTVIDLTADHGNASGEINSGGSVSEVRNSALDFIPVSTPTANVLPYYDPLTLYNSPFTVVRRPTDSVVDGVEAQTQRTIRTVYDRFRQHVNNYCEPTTTSIHSSDSAYRFDDGGTLDPIGHPVDHGVPRFIGLVSSRRAQTIAAATGAVPLGGKPCGSSRQPRLSRTTLPQQQLQQQPQQGYASVPLHFSSSSTANSLRVGHHWSSRAHPYESHISSPALPETSVSSLPGQAVGASVGIEGYLPMTVQHHHSPGVLDMSASHQQLIDGSRPHSDASSLRGQNVSVFAGALPSMAYSGRSVMDGQGSYNVPGANQSILSNRLSRSVYQTSGQMLQEQQGRVVVVDDIREKSITGRSRKTARSTLRNSNPVFPSTNFSSLLHSNFQQPSSSQNPAMGTSFYAPSIRKSNPLVNNRAAVAAVTQGLVAGPVVADRYLNEEVFSVHDLSSGHLFPQPCSVLPAQARHSELGFGEPPPPLHAPTLLPSASPANVHAPGNYSPISMDSFLDSLDCASHEVEEPVDEDYQSIGTLAAARTARFTDGSTMDVPDVSGTFANPTNRYLVIRPGLTKRKPSHQQENPGVGQMPVSGNASSLKKPASSSRDI